MWSPVVAVQHRRHPLLDVVESCRFVQVRLGIVVAVDSDVSKEREVVLEVKVRPVEAALVPNRPLRTLNLLEVQKLQNQRGVITPHV